LKPPSRYTQVGQSLPRPDIAAKVTGRHVYVHDFALPGMLHARIVRPPAVGATLQSVDEASVSRLPRRAGRADEEFRSPSSAPTNGRQCALRAS
jgi:hypothetical protein